MPFLKYCCISGKELQFNTYLSRQLVPTYLSFILMDLESSGMLVPENGLFSMSKDVKSPQMGWICAGQKKISGVVERSSYILVSLSWDRRTIVSWLTSMMTGKAPHFHRKSINLTFCPFI